MPLTKLQLKPGVNRENTSYTSEGGWYECDKVRFRQGFPEKIGGWQRYSPNTYQGICRSLKHWVTLGGLKLLGLGTHLKFYIEAGEQYYDVTPLRATETLTDPFTTVSGSAVVTVTDVAGGYINGDFVTFSGATAVGGITLSGEYQIVYTVGSTYTITASSTASSSASGGGTVTAAYQINIGPSIVTPYVGWGAGGWGIGTWSNGESTTDIVRIWTQGTFGEDLLFGPRGGAIYYWGVNSTGLTSRAALLSAEAGASDVPIVQNSILVSDANRFVFCFGTNAIGTSAIDNMLIRWSDQESMVDWTPSATNQAGNLRLSNGTEIVAVAQARQEILVWTNSALYSLQFVGAPVVWGSQLVGSNISIVSSNSVAYVSGVAYWMGVGKFYKYDGQVQSLICNLRGHVFGGRNILQDRQVFAGVNEAFHELWWFYCSTNSEALDKYVIYNYVANIWYYGSLGRTAWIDSKINEYPIAATYSNNLVNHEVGADDGESATLQAISSSITSAQFDLDDGHQFMFVDRILPDVRFDGSTNGSPAITMEVLPLMDSGSGYNNPRSQGGNNSGAVTRSSTSPIEAYTSQVDLRIRGRQIAISFSSDAVGVAWQLGTPRVSMRPDGRR